MKILHLLLCVSLCLPYSLFAQETIDVDRALEIAADELLNLGLQADDLEAFRVSDQYRSQHNGVQHLYLNQQFQGIDLRNAMIGIHLGVNNDLIHLTSNFVLNASRYIQSQTLGIGAQDALQSAVNHLELEDWSLSTIIQQASTPDLTTTFSKGNLSLEDIKVHLSFVPTDEKHWTLAWLVNIYQLDAQHRWEVFVDASNGQIIGKQDHVIHCKWDDPKTACTLNHEHRGSELIQSAKQLDAAPNQYGVFPIPVESPSHGSASVVTNPAADNLEASPFGWHDTDGSAGADFTITRGNNTHAYQDQNNSNSSSGDEPDGGATLDFSAFIPNLNQSPFNYTDEATVNLFYWCNVMHDVWYNYGFDEVSGNFQQNNYGKGGADGDYIRAESQDAANLGTRDNANFSSGADGSTARIQMYLWSATSSDLLTINSPVSVSGGYSASPANFGPALNGTAITASVQFVDDGSGNPSLGCSSSTPGSLTGQIAMIDRGTCDFSEKVYNAQQAGAIAVIVCNNEAVGTFTMAPGINAGLVTIPSIMISQSDCATIRVELPGVNATLQDAGSLELDGDFDNGIVAHEYGHGISIRLTGGPSTGGCLGNNEQMGEGWSDYFGLMMTMEPGDARTDIRGIGTYALGEPTTGLGIRPAPYSTDASINNFTYGDITNTGTISLPHGIGFLWCTMLWEMTWDLIDIYGFDTDLYEGTGGNNIAMQLVMDGIKLQGCNPGFIDGRDAILAADLANYGGIHQCVIWEAFARRGLGDGASQGSSNNRNDGNENFNIPASLSGVILQKTANLTEVTEASTVDYTLNVKTICDDASSIELIDNLPGNASYVNGSASNGGSLNGNNVEYPTIGSLSENSEFSYSLQAQADFGSYFDPVVVLDDDLESGSGNWISSGTGGSWTLSGSNPNSGSTSWFVPNQSSQSDIQLRTSSAFVPSGQATLSFWHDYDTERTWDGGVVEISIDGGNNWSDLGAYMTQNGYNSLLNSSDNNVVDQRPAFSGTSNGYIQTRIDLCAFSGESVFIRFRMGSDGSASETGWFIDDITIIDEAALVNRASVTSAANGGSEDAVCTKVNPLLLPLEILSIDAFPQDDQILLSWETASEVGIQGFDIERRAENENDFVWIGQLGASGLSNGSKKYNFPDRSVLPGVRYYYRLKIKEMDGLSAYSSIVTAILAKDAFTLDLFPQPADQQINLRLVSPQAERVQFEILNASGQSLDSGVFDLTAGIQQISWDVSKLAAGVYFIQLSGESIQINRKLIIQ